MFIKSNQLKAAGYRNNNNNNNNNNQKTALLGTEKILRKVLSCKKKEKRDLGHVVTCCNPLPRTINQAEHLF